MSRVRKDARAVVALLATLSIGSAAALAAQASGGTASNERAARADAPRLLATLAVPPGATPVAADPSRSKVLGAAPSRPATPALVDVHEFWRVPGDPQSALDWIQAHPPSPNHDTTGRTLTRTGAESAWDGYSFSPIPGRLSSRLVLVTAARATGGGTALRADAQVMSVVTRPAWERIPAGIREVMITAHRPGKPASAPVTVTVRNKVRRIVALVDALPRAQPGAVACPNDVGPEVRLAFRHTPGAAPLAIATADGSGCGGVTFRLRGHSGPPLAGGPGLIRRLSSLLRIGLG
jgi:hypothetical protein